MIIIDQSKPYVFKHRKEGFPGDKSFPTRFTHYKWEERNGLWNYGQYQELVNGEYVLINRTDGHIWFNQASTAYDSVYTTLHNAALRKLLPQLDVCQNMFEAWYERREAYALALEAVEKILEFVQNWRKPKYWKKIAKGAKQPSTLPEAWITYQFGIMPLIGTIDTCLQGLGQPLPSARFNARVRRKVKQKLDTNIWCEFDAGLEMGVLVQPNPNPNTALLNLGGFTAPFSTAWSVAPWGWGVDYIVNASELLSNLEVRHPGVTILCGYTTTSMTNGKWYGTSQERDPKKGYMYVVDGVFYNINRFPTIDLKYKLELSFPTLGSNKLANLMSALALTMKGGK